MTSWCPEITQGVAVDIEGFTADPSFFGPNGPGDRRPRPYVIELAEAGVGQELIEALVPSLSLKPLLKLLQTFSCATVIEVKFD